MPSPRWKRILITGACGRLGTQLRAGLAGSAQTLRLTDIRHVADAAHAACHRWNWIANAGLRQDYGWDHYRCDRHCHCRYDPHRDAARRRCAVRALP